MLSSRPLLRLAYIVSHPIQYQAPLLRRIAAEPGIDLTVFFCSDFSTREYRDEGFGTSVKWDVPLTEGYRYVVLPRILETTSPAPTRPISFGFFRHFLRGVDGHRFDAVWVHGYATINALHAILAANLLGIPVLLRAEGWLRDRERSTSTLLLKKWFFALLRRGIDAALPIGTLNRQYWQHYFGPQFPLFDMPYAVDNERFQRLSRLAADGRELLRAELHLDPERPVILFASKLQTRKHCDHLLQAYLDLRTEDGRDPYPYLVIVGDGEQRPALERMVQESGCTSVRFAGFQNQSQLPRYFDLSAVFVLPSKHEPWGLIVNEAMNAARAIIVTDDVGSAPDLVQDGVNGRVYSFGDISALTAALLEIVGPHGSAEEMGAASLQRIHEWSYEADLRGLRNALAYVTGRDAGEAL